MLFFLPFLLDSQSHLVVASKIRIMLPTTIRSPPSPEDYIPLEQYQSQTPESFIDSKPVLHFHLVGAKATIPKSQRGSLALFPADATSVGGSETNGEHEHLIEQTVDVLANSE